VFMTSLVIKQTDVLMHIIEAETCGDYFSLSCCQQMNIRRQRRHRKTNPLL